jgi:hypothetical protein
LVCFTHPQVPTDEAGSAAFMQRVVDRGRVWISNVKIPGVGWALRACVTSFRTNEEDVQVLIDELEAVLPGS